MKPPTQRLGATQPSPVRPLRRASGCGRSALGLMLAAFMAAVLGCQQPATPPRRPVVQSISKEEMIYRIVTDVQRIATLKGKCRVIAIDQNLVVPASAADARKRAEGRPFQAAFQRHNLSGVFVLDRRTPGVPPRMRLHAEVPGVTPVLEALALADAFWVKVPNPERGLEGYRSVLFRGVHEREKPRSEMDLSMRPQDIADLMLSLELLPTAPFQKAYTLETWPEYYVLTVMRIDHEGELPWATPIYSRIWVERHNLTVAMRQIFDVEGTMVAEARFTNYLSMPVRIGEERRPATVRIPRGIRFVWPQDRAILELRFREGDLLLNQSIPESTWRPPKAHDAVIRNLSPEKDDEYFEDFVPRPLQGLPEVPVPEER